MPVVLIFGCAMAQLTSTNNETVIAMHAPTNRTSYPVNPTLESSAHSSPPRRTARKNPCPATSRWPCSGPHSPGAAKRPTDSQGVELVLSSGTPTPAMTFEVRFEAPMVAGSQVGVPVTNSPLVITPPLAGTFTWLSAHSGVFTPTEPLALDTRYDLRLRPGLQRADGQPSRAILHRTLTTPPLAWWHPRHGEPIPTPLPSRRSSSPSTLTFEPERRSGIAYFQDSSGRRIPADVRQATWEEVGYELGGPWSLRTWTQQFIAAKSSAVFWPRRASRERTRRTNWRTCSLQRHVRRCRSAKAGVWLSALELQRGTIRCACAKPRQCRWVMSRRSLSPRSLRQQLRQLGPLDSAFVFQAGLGIAHETVSLTGWRSAPVRRISPCKLRGGAWCCAGISRARLGTH